MTTKKEMKMTPENAVMPAGKVNRFEVFHRERNRDIRFYMEFEDTVDSILAHKDTPTIVPVRVLRDIISRDYPWVRWQVGGIDVFKAMLSWYRYRNPTKVARFRHRKTEQGRRLTSGINWAAKSKTTVTLTTIMQLVQQLRKTNRRTTMTLLKRDAGVRFNQNFNAEVAQFIRNLYPSLTEFLPSKRNRVR
jgi:hypothetical protein